MAPSLFSVYVIQSVEGYRYIGQTEDLDHRLVQHNHGESFSTRRGTQWKLIYSEPFRTRREAIIRERWLKSGRGREFLKTVLSVSGS